MEKPKGKPFLEILAASIHEDFRFPILEVFAFLYAISTFVLVQIGGGYTLSIAGSEESLAYSLVSIQMGTPLFIFLILIFKNVAYGFGSDLEKGTIQTLLAYPIKRHMILTAKLLSAIGISLAMFLGIQFFALYLMAPQTVANQMPTVITAYLASLSYPLLITAIMLLIAMKVRKGGTALVLGIVLYFAISMASGILTILYIFTGNATPLKILAIIQPSTALQFHYTRIGTLISQGQIETWTPSFSEALTYIAGGYCLVAAAYLISYYYFSRRLNI